jgi:hypothetical protein
MLFYHTLFVIQYVFFLTNNFLLFKSFYGVQVYDDGYLMGCLAVNRRDENFTSNCMSSTLKKREEAENKL